MDAGMAGRYWLEGFVEKTLSTLSQRATDFPTLLEGLRLTKPGMSTVSMTLHAVAKRYPQLTEAKILNLNEIQDHFKPRPGDEALNLANPRKDTLDPEIFAEVIKHIAQLTKSSVDEPALVVMDDNDWHLSLEAIEAAKNNGVVMLAVPAHLSARVLALESLTTRFLEVYNEAVRESLQRVLTVESMTRFLDVAAEEVFTKEAVRDAFVMSELYRLTKNCGRQPEVDQETEADGAVVLLVGVDDVSDYEDARVQPKMARKNSEWHCLETLPAFKRQELTEYLTELLRKSLDGQAVLSAYEQGAFNNTMRCMLTEILVNHEMNNSITNRISGEKFRYMALAITSVFPSESALIYYVPHVNLGRGKKMSPRGRLFEKYQRKMRVYRGFHIGAYLEQQKPKNAKPARFVCPICQASYSSHYSLKYHMKSHTGETTCAICSKTFTMKASLKQHLIMVHHLAR
ncbi:unnamed protein product [Bemisia tabaci]|uniref:C2H2-type domain-containing protein n=1 Tax=Bemisia tabaci TaxID=7038 RepID=A0A9P0AFP0_BEMTA|nr:unnamed protein product [Bemisia tabaci]